MYSIKSDAAVCIPAGLYGATDLIAFSMSPWLNSITSPSLVADTILSDRGEYSRPRNLNLLSHLPP